MASKQGLPNIPVFRPHSYGHHQSPGVRQGSLLLNIVSAESLFIATLAWRAEGQLWSSGGETQIHNGKPP